MLDSGSIITCMERVFILGKMEDVMKESINSTKNMAMVYIFGQMEEVLFFYKT